MTTRGNDVVSAPRITRAQQQQQQHTPPQPPPNTAHQPYTTAGITTDCYAPAAACTLLLMNASVAKSDILILLSSQSTHVHVRIWKKIAVHRINSYVTRALHQSLE